MNQNQRPLHLLITHDLYAKLRSRALELEVSKAYVVRAALKQYLATRTLEETRLDIFHDEE